jgi:hypothetical protein
MIQRIQTIFLLLAAIAVGLMFIFPLADYANGSGVKFIFRYRGLYDFSGGKETLTTSSIPLAVLLTINLLLPLISIFMYKKRILQMRICVLNIILLLGSMGLIAFYVASSFSKIEASLNYRIFALMSVISLILHVMAYSAIKKDEKLVKSVDRIR